MTAQGDDTEPELTPDDPNFESKKLWPGATEAKNLAGISMRTLQRWVQSGQVERIRYQGRYLYNPDDLGSLPKGESSLEVLIASYDKALKTRDNFVLSLVGRLENTWNMLQQAQHSLTESLTKRVEILERGHEEALQARESAMNEQAERNMAEREQIQSIRQKETLLQFLTQNLGPHIMGGMSPAAKLAKALKRDDLITLLQMGVLSPEQEQALKEYLAATAPPETKPETEATESNTEETNHVES